MFDEQGNDEDQDCHLAPNVSHKSHIFSIFQRLIGAVAGIVVQRQVISHTERRARSHM